MSNSQSKFDQVAGAVGDVCIWWSAIDNVIHSISLHISVVLEPGFETRKSWEILHIALSHMEIRQRIATAKSLAHHIAAPRSPDFYDRAEELFNYVDNDLRLERNRYIHDQWELDGDAVLRATLAPRVRRAQAGKRSFAIYTERRYPNVAAIRAFVVNLEQTFRDLCDLDNHLAWLSSQQERPTEYSQPLPAEWKCLAHSPLRPKRKPRPRPRP